MGKIQEIKNLPPFIHLSSIPKPDYIIDDTIMFKGSYQKYPKGVLNSMPLAGEETIQTYEKKEGMR